MRTFVVFKMESDHARAVMTFLDEFARRTGRELDTVDPETPDGAHTCRTYDIVEYPSVVAVDDNGQMQRLWRGLPMPLVSEVSYYA